MPAAEMNGRDGKEECRRRKWHVTEKRFACIISRPGSVRRGGRLLTGIIARDVKSMFRGPGSVIRTRRKKS